MVFLFFVFFPTQASQLSRDEVSDAFSGAANAYGALQIIPLVTSVAEFPLENTCALFKRDPAGQYSVLRYVCNKHARTHKLIRLRLSSLMHTHIHMRLENTCALFKRDPAGQSHTHMLVHTHAYFIALHSTYLLIVHNIRREPWTTVRPAAWGRSGNATDCNYVPLLANDCPNSYFEKVCVISEK